MEDLKQKFVIIDNEIMIGRVKTHKELHPKPDSGGLWFWDDQKSVLYLYGASYDFGSPSEAEVKEAYLTGVLEDNEVRYIIGETDLFNVLEPHMSKERARNLIDENDYVS